MSVMTLASSILKPRPARPSPSKRITEREAAALQEEAIFLQGRPLPGVHISEAEFEARFLHEDLNAEWVDGEVFLTAPANTAHDDLQRWLGTLLTMYVDHHSAGKILGPETQIRLAKIPSRRNPDLLFVSKANLGRIHKTYFDGAPDLVIELVSPDSESRDWREKFFEYQASGVREYWLIDPASSTFEAYTLGRGKRFQRLATDKDGRIHSKVLRGFHVQPAWLWQSARPKLLAILKELGVR